MDDSQLWTLRNVARYLQVSIKTVRRMMDEDPDFPRPIPVRGALRFRPADLHAWERLQVLKEELTRRLRAELAAGAGGPGGAAGPPGDAAGQAGPARDAAGQSGTRGDTAGQSGTTAPDGGNPPGKPTKRG